MSTWFVHCGLKRVSDQSQILSVLEQNVLNIDASYGVLIGSRAVRRFLPNFRELQRDDTADWDIICSAKFLLQWLRTKIKSIDSINMIIPESNDNDQLDMYVYCILTDESKYDFSIPQSSTSYTAYILNNSVKWIKPEFYSGIWTEDSLIRIASLKLLIILKKYMLYYTHQWQKTAKDYRELLPVTPSLTEDDRTMCELFTQYNEKIHGSRPPIVDDFTIEKINNFLDMMLMC